MRIHTPTASRRAALALVGLLLLSSLAGLSAIGKTSPLTSSQGSEPILGGSPLGAITPLTGGAFAVTFQETGLPAGTNWSVTFNGSLNGSTSASVGFSAPNGTYAFNLSAVPGFVPAPPSGNLSVSGLNVSQTIPFTAFEFAVTFSESGLPGATNWGVTFAGIPHNTSTGQIGLTAPNGTYPYTAEAPPGFTAAPASGNVTVANGSADIAIAFSAVLYPVTFSQTGLNGTNWSVNLDGAVNITNGTNATFEEPNGTYSFTVGSPSGYSATPASGSEIVAGAAVLRNLTFAAIPPTQFTLTFNETGLAPGTRWWANLTIAHSSSTGPSIVYLKGAASYRFTIGVAPGYTPAPSSGTAVVSGATWVDIVFTPILYAVDFTESGLPSGATWSVQLGSTWNESTTATVGFQEANGTIPYAIEAVPGYRSAPLNGSVTITGTSVEVEVVFSAVNYTVTFSETGLPVLTRWSVTVGAHLVSGDTPELIHPESNGSYRFVLGAVPGYVAVPPSGNVTVNGSAVVVTVAFSSFQFLVTFSQTGLNGSTSWTVSLAASPRTGGGTTHTYLEPNGTYSFQVATVPGYTVAPTSGNVTVAGADVQESLTFTPLPPGTYPVTFKEAGLSGSALWSVDLAGRVANSSSTQIAFAEKNGTYNFTIGTTPGFRASPSKGSVTVDGAWTNVSITFEVVAPSTFEVAFNETGLPAATHWSVDVNGSLLQGSTPTLFTNESNGSYDFQVTAVSGYNVSLTSGTVVVTGQSVNESVQFSAIPAPRYEVRFAESGLPSGTNWSVTLNGTSGASTGETLAAGTLPAGTYGFSVRSSGYAAQPATGTVTVASGPVTVNITFSALPPPPPPASAHGALSGPTLVFLGAMGIVVLAAVGIAVATRRGRQSEH